MKNANIKIAPSILSADFSKMGEEVENLQDFGADIIHCDVMDGVFVPNITFGIKMVADIKKRAKIPLDCHLMIVNPEKYVEAFVNAGADYVTVHYEACTDNLFSVLTRIKNAGAKCGVAINPDTAPDKIAEVIPYCDMVLVMSVFPGFGGQKFIESSLRSVAFVKKIAQEKNLDILIEVDGGINFDTVKSAKDAGANVIVAGSGIFSERDRKEAIYKLRTI